MSICAANIDRADRALIALTHYAQAMDPHEDVQASEYVSGLLADLMHYCDENHLDFSTFLTSAHCHHEEEQPVNSYCGECGAVSGPEDDGTTCRDCGRGIMQGVTL